MPARRMPPRCSAPFSSLTAFLPQPQYPPHVLTRPVPPGTQCGGPGNSTALGILMQVCWRTRGDTAVRSRSGRPARSQGHPGGTRVGDASPCSEVAVPSDALPSTVRGFRGPMASPPISSLGGHFGYPVACGNRAAEVGPERGLFRESGAEEGVAQETWTRGPLPCVSLSPRAPRCLIS